MMASKHRGERPCDPISPLVLMALVCCAIRLLSGLKTERPPKTEGIPLVVEVRPAELVGKVVRVTDGDTLVLFVEPGPRELNVRLAGIDAPQKEQDFGSAAREALADEVMGRSVTVRLEGRDRDGCTIGVVSIDGEEINRWLVEAGWAWHYARYYNSAELAAAEQAAREAKRGLWAGKKPIPPWEWRTAKKKE